MVTISSTVPINVFSEMKTTYVEYLEKHEEIFKARRQQKLDRFLFF